MNVRFSLLAKIYLATAVAVTTLFGAAGWFFLYQASTALHAGLEQEVRASLATVDASLESRAEHLATASALLASMSDIRAAFGSKDASTIRDTASEFWARAQAGHSHVESAIFTVATPEGLVVASVAARAPLALQVGHALPIGVLGPARRAFPWQSGAYAKWDATVWQILVTPVYVDSSDTPALLNILVAAHPLSRETLQELKERTGGIDFVLRTADDKTQLATLDAAALAQIVSQPIHFAIRSTVLRDGDGNPLAELWAVRPFQEVEARIAALRQKMIVAWLIAMTSGLALSYFLARRLVRPVRALNDAAQQVARDNFSVRVPEDSYDELGVLARTFNRMSASIQLSRDEQIRSGQIVAIGRLAASIAHDLRNPLAAVVGGSEMLADFNLPPEQIKQTASHVNKAARRMASLLDEVGQVARAKPGQREECRLEDLVTSAVESQSSKAADQGVQIHRFTDANPKVRCERLRVERVLVNLIANALDVMPDGGEISIRAWSDAGAAWMEIADTGPGVPQDVRAKLFQPFATAGKPDGLGLGLALARQTMLDHGGDLEWIPSETGARFRLRLPLA